MAVDLWSGIGNSIGGFAKGVGSLFSDTAGNAYSLLTGRPQDVNYNQTLKAASYNPWAETKTPTTAPTPKTVTYNSEGSGTNAADDYYKSLSEYYKSQIQTTPRFIDYDIGGSWNKAREMAANAVNPVYQQKLTDYVNRQQSELGRQREDTVTSKSQLDLALKQLYDDSTVNRARTTEDVTGNIRDIQDTRNYEARQEGLSFDTANRSLNESLGATGMATSGLGQQAVQESQLARRDQSNEVIRQSDNKIESQKTLMNRTFEDLTTREQRGEEKTTTSKTKLDIDLERFIEDQEFDLDQEQKSLELKKQSDIAGKSIGLQSQLVDQWLSNLRGQGYTADEISRAAAIYK